MAEGSLEVLLVGAKGLDNTDYLCDMDPYAVLAITSQEQKSSVASGQGSEPEWNETFVFTTSEHATDLIIKLRDSDAGTEDDDVGEAKIPLNVVYNSEDGCIPPTVYSVVKDEEYRGEIKIGLKFTPVRD